MRFLILLTVVSFLSFPAVSQDMNFEEYLENEDIVILKEKTDLLFTGDKAYLIEVIVSKDISYKINHARGIPEIQLLVVPEPFDPTSIIHTTDIRSNAFLFRRVAVKELSATVEKPDGSIQEIQPEINVVSERLYTATLGETEYYEYRFNGLEEGDILNISYKYTFPYSNNWQKLFSARVFFHSKYPKRSFDFSMTHSNFLTIDTAFVHLSPPEYIAGEKTKTYSWHLENLPGCLDEAGGRPYRELPQFIFSAKPYDLIYEHWDSFIQEFVPLWLMLSFDRERKIRPAVVDNDIGAKDKDNLLYEKIAKRFLSMAGDDPTGYKRLQMFQKWMADTVKYDAALSYYDNLENYMIARPAKNLYTGTIRDFAIESSYANLLLKMDLNFFTAYPCDKRSGEISERYFSPIYNNDLLFAAILKNDIVSFLVPRSQHNQYHLEELPFYYEDIPVILIHTNDFGGYKSNMADSIRFINTPASMLKDNSRQIKGSIQADLGKRSLKFDTRLTLSGQYSTLCRPAYFGRATDQTILPSYNQKIYDLPGPVKLGKVKMEMVEDFFPFKTTVTAEYELSESIKKEGTGYSLDLSGIINHVIFEEFDTTYRFMDFYPDFLGTDQYIYQIVFNKAVELVEEIPEISLSNQYFTYSFSVKQQTPTVISVISYLSWNEPLIPREEVSVVYDLFENIKKNKALSVFVTPR